MRVLIFVSSLLLAMASHSQWVTYPEDLEQFDYSGDKLQQHWPQLAAATGLPWPDEAFIEAMMTKFPQLAEQLQKRANKDNAPAALKAALDNNYQPLAIAVQQVWRLHYQGQYQQANELGMTLTPAGLFPALYAKLIHTTYLVENNKEKEKGFVEVDKIIAQVLPIANDYHYIIFGNAYQKARRLELMSTTAATASGLLGPTQDDLRKLHKQFPDNSLYSAMLAGIDAGIIERVGSFIGGITYGADEDKTIERFQQALNAQPHLAVLYNEFAQVILRLDNSDYDALLLTSLKQCDQLTIYSAEEALNQKSCRLLLAQLK
jgi:hypothetical protein